MRRWDSKKCKIQSNSFENAKKKQKYNIRSICVRCNCYSRRVYWFLFFGSLLCGCVKIKAQKTTYKIDSVGQIPLESTRYSEMLVNIMLSCYNRYKYKCLVNFSVNGNKRFRKWSEQEKKKCDRDFDVNKKNLLALKMMSFEL